jgi:hypothetical protein
MQVSAGERGEATARGRMADGAVCKGNHQKQRRIGPGPVHHMLTVVSVDGEREKGEYERERERETKRIGSKGAG